MAEELDFSLPPAKQRKSLSGAIVVLLLVAVLVVGGVNLWMALSGPSQDITATGELGPEQLKELAGKLTARNLHEAAVGVWQEYLHGASLSKQEKAQVLFRIGDLLLKADKPKEAIEYFYRSEIVAPMDELASQINAKVQECFEKAGEFAALRYEIMQRSSFQPTGDEATEVVAQIGPEKMTAAQLDALIEDQIDARLRRFSAMLPPEQARAQKEAIVSQFTNPQQKLQLLQGIMAQEALYREALAQKLDEEAVTKKQMRNVTRDFLAQQLLEGETTGKVNITESDLQTYYQANKDKYVTEEKEQKSFDEVKHEIYQTLFQQKNQQLQQQLIESLMDKYNIVIHREAFQSKEDAEKTDQP
jgi:hypothetical protein